MRRFLLSLVPIAVLSCTASRGSAQSAVAGGSLPSFFASQGFAGAPLKRRFGNHLLVPVTINAHHAALMVDTGAPYTIIDRDSVGTLGLKVENTKFNVGRVFGATRDRYGLSAVGTIAMGNCMLTNVPVAVADESDMNYYTRFAHIDGLFGAHEMRKFGVVIDCARQMLYVSPAGPNSAVSGKLAALLASRGFTRVPMRVNGNSHFEVDAAINGHPTRLVVDTGSATTLLGRQLGVAAGVAPVPLRMGVDAGGGRIERLSSGTAGELAIGDFKVSQADVTLGDVSNEVLRSKVESEANAGLLGIEHMSLNFAVIDVGGMSLYLRHPDKR
jgi:predicted aspartyl protease